MRATAAALLLACALAPTVRAQQLVDPPHIPYLDQLEYSQAEEEQQPQSAGGEPAGDRWGSLHAAAWCTFRDGAADVGSYCDGGLAAMVTGWRVGHLAVGPVVLVGTKSVGVGLAVRVREATDGSPAVAFGVGWVVPWDERGLDAGGGRLAAGATFGF